MATTKKIKKYQNSGPALVKPAIENIADKRLDKPGPILNRSEALSKVAAKAAENSSKNIATKNMADQMMKRASMDMKTGGKVKKAKDGKWIQKAVNPAHKGFCTPLSKKTCTPKRKALALTLKKIGKARKGK
jgi:hypothetical protein